MNSTISTTTANPRYYISSCITPKYRRNRLRKTLDKLGNELFRVSPLTLKKYRSLRAYIGCPGRSELCFLVLLRFTSNICIIIFPYWLTHVTFSLRRPAIRIVKLFTGTKSSMHSGGIRERNEICVWCMKFHKELFLLIWIWSVLFRLGRNSSVSHIDSYRVKLHMSFQKKFTTQCKSTQDVTIGTYGGTPSCVLDSDESRYREWKIYWLYSINRFFSFMITLYAMPDEWGIDHNIFIALVST
jgi:hypothetical protein